MRKHKHDLDYSRLDPGQLKACLGAGPALELVNSQQEFTLQQPWITVNNGPHPWSSANNQRDHLLILCHLPSCLPLNKGLLGRAVLIKKNQEGLEEKRLMIELNLQMIGSDRDQMVHHLHAEDTVVCYTTCPTKSNDYHKRKKKATACASSRMSLCALMTGLRCIVSVT